jgi:hypothetical protein
LYGRAGRSTAENGGFRPGQKLKDVSTEWRAGTAVEVGWMVGANHGGGYVYSVCPAMSTLNERCFNAHVLPFVGANTTIRYLDGRGDIVIPAADVAVGTFPAGSRWRRNPIPACNCDGGDGCHAPGTRNAGGRASYRSLSLSEGLSVLI